MTRPQAAEAAHLALALNTSLMVYAILVVLLFALALLMTVLPLQINQGQQVSWPAVFVVALLGGVGVWLSPRAGFPPMWDRRIAHRQRFWIPAVAGMGLGLVMVLIDLVQPLGAQAQTPFPDSLVVFAFAGLFEEIALHLFLTTALIWLIAGVLLRGRYQTPVFWGVAVGGAVLYWLFQLNAVRLYFPEQFSVPLVIQTGLVILTTVAGGAYAFRRGGFLAALSLRYGFYFVWHIIWGGGIGLVHYLLS